MNLLATLLALLSTAAACAAGIHSGCFLASEANGVLRHRAFTSSKITHELCRDACLRKASAYFGLLGGNQCFCGNTLYEPQNVREDFCKWRCSGNRKQQCGSDMGIKVFSLRGADRKTLTSAGTSANGIPPKLLFAISAHSGASALAVFQMTSSIESPPNGQIPQLFRSSLLNDLQGSIRRFGATRISAEMHKNGRIVASAEFDVARDINEIDLTSWFSPKRLVRTHPFWTGNSASSFEYFSVNGHEARHPAGLGLYRRTFYIEYNHGNCLIDSGLMGIGERGTLDACWWVRNGGFMRPILFYAKRKGAYAAGAVAYADRFLIYLK